MKEFRDWKLTLEERLLLLCIGTRLDARARRSAHELSGRPELDWSRFFELAIRHGVAPLAHARIDALIRAQTPSSLRSQLENRNRVVIFRNLQLTGELLRLDAAFAREGIRLVWFKGPVLTQQLFSNVFLREYSDLDVLAPIDRIDCAVRILAERGYVPAYALTSPRQRRLLQRISNEQSFTNSHTGVCVDLHWSLTENVYSFSDRTALRTRTTELAGRPVLTFGPEETLCYLCYHASKHGWTVFRHISDVAELLRVHPELNWKGMIEERLPIGTPRMLQLGLLLADVCLSAPLPASAMTWSRADRKVLQTARKILARGETPSKLFEPSIYLNVMPPLDRLRYAAAVVLRPSPLELEILSLPDRLFFLYALLRYLRLARKYSRNICATLMKSRCVWRFFTSRRRSGPPP